MDCEACFWKMSIRCDKRIQNGRPVVAGTRVAVSLILRELACSGLNLESFLNNYTHISKENVQEALTYAAKELDK